MEVDEKRPYSTPQLIRHGTLEELTLGCDKKYGSSDGYTFSGSPIMCNGGS